MRTVENLPKTHATDAQPPRREPSDEMLIQLIVKRDKGAMRALFERHKLKIYRFILRIVGDAPLADDIVSEVFLDVWRRAATFEAKSQVSTWLLAIARNKALGARRRLAATSLDCDAVSAIIDPADDPEIAAHRNGRNAFIRNCLTQLSPAHREIIDLVYYHERSIRDIAQIMGIPAGTVKSRVFHARRRVEELLAEAGIHNAWAC